MELIFGHPFYLIFLLSIPLVIVSHFYSLRYAKKRGMKFANFEALKRVTGTRLITKNRTLLLLRVLSLFSLVLSLSSPILWYQGPVDTQDYMIAIDASASMTSEDIPPNRLIAAKTAAQKFVESQKPQSQIGVMAFSGVSFLKLPLTSDKKRVERAIESITVMKSGGTDIGSALITGTNMLLLSRKAKTIILITDGSDTGGAFIEDSLQGGLQYAKAHHVVVHTIGIGTENGKADYAGVPLLPNYDKDALKKIAVATEGQFFQANSISTITDAFSQIKDEEKGAIHVDMSVELFLFGMVMLFVEWGLLNTRFRVIP